MARTSPALAAALALALVLAPMAGAAPTAPAHADTAANDWPGLREAFDAGGAQTIALAADIVAPVDEGLALKAGDAVTLDLSGRNLRIELDVSVNAAAIGVPVGAALTIVDTVGGGALIVRGGEMSAGIGGMRSATGGTHAPPGSVTISGGRVEATGGRLGAGIGGGWEQSAGTLLITGGTVIATSRQSGAGIGGGQNGTGSGSITITGGVVEASGTSGGAGIGGGNNGRGVATTITGGDVTAIGWTYAAGIGGGYGGHGAAVTLSGGSVYAVGGNYAAGIGAGMGLNDDSSSQRNPGTLTITGTARPGSSTADGGTATGRSFPGRGGVVTIQSGPKSFFASNARDGSRGRFVIDFGWMVTFDVNGGTGIPDPQFVHEVDGLVTMPTAPTREEPLAFASWRVDTDDGTRWDFAATPTADILLVARWVVPWDIAYELDGGTNENPTQYTADWLPMTLTAPVRDGFVFLGWTGEGHLTPTHPVTLLTETGPLAFMAHWEPDTPTSTVAPSITGGTDLGDVLTADPGDWDLDGLAFAYQWLRDGTPIPDAESATYQVVTEDLGTTLAVEVTASRAGDDRYHPTVARSDGHVVPLGILDFPLPVVTGTWAVGQTLSASASATPAADELRYQWLRDGTPIADATGSEYTLVADDLDAHVAVRVTAVAAHYEDAEATSVSQLVGPGDFVLLAAPELGGTAGVGHELVASPGAWTPTPAGVAYQWLRDGTPIADATGSTYRLVADDERANVSVLVAVSAPGYHAADHTTPAVLVDERPFGAPPPVDAAELTDEAAGGATTTRTGSTATLQLPDPALEGRWVHVYGYSIPVPLGWHRVVDGTVRLNVAALDAEAHRLAALTVDGSLAGWAGIPALPLAATGSTPPLALLWVAAALLAGAGVAGAIALRRRTARTDRAEDPASR